MRKAMRLVIDDEVGNRFPDMMVLLAEIDSVRVSERSDELEEFKAEVYGRIRGRYRLDTLKEEPTIRAYRDFFWKIGIDPTKIRPAAEALLRRILRGKGIPRINTLVDSYNLASAESGIAIAAFDLDRLVGKVLRMRFARRGESFLGIGMEKPRILRGGEIVISDAEKLIAIYPYRDAEDSKITLQTNRVLLMICGVPGLTLELLENCRELSVRYILRFCEGVINEPNQYI